MSALSPSLAKLELMLLEANGEFVAGADLAKAIGIPLMNLSNFIKALRTARPHQIIEGRRPHGYRLYGKAAPAPQYEPPPKPRAGGGRRYRDGAYSPPHLVAKDLRSLLDALLPSAAALVKSVALESGESTEETLHRLLSYGAEVHHDLVAGGANPAGLRAMPVQVAA